MAGEWDQRMLCDDGTCIGVIGTDGTCKVCGHVAPNWGDERRRGLTPLPPESPTETADAAVADSADAAEDDDEYEDDDDDEDDEYEDDTDDDDSPNDAVSDPDWQSRKLCSDGACVGVIGADGTCTTCGKRPTE